MSQKPANSAQGELPKSSHNVKVPCESSAYSAPRMYVIGTSSDLLQGSGRHKNDDTGHRGFIVDQH